MRQLLEGARFEQDRRAIRPGGTPLENLSRRAMIQHVRLAGARYGLQADIDAYLALADCASLSGLESAQLSSLAEFVSGAMDRMATASDSPDGPPAG
jgi:hypothetical protein